MNVKPTRWPRGQMRWPAAVRLLGSRVRVPLRVWLFALVFVLCFGGSGLCDESFTRLEASYWACLSNSVVKKSQNRGCLGPIWNIGLRRKIRHHMTIELKKNIRCTKLRILGFILLIHAQFKQKNFFFRQG
jgi:hypothetical protein